MAKNSKAMSKSALIGHLAEQNEMTRKQVIGFMDCLINTAYKNAKNGFTFPGIGKLVLVNRKARMGRNPQTNQPIQIKASRTVGFRAGSSLKTSV